VSDIQVSQQGYDRLIQELNELRSVRRPQIREAIQRAREFGDLSENSEYNSAKDEQGRIEGRITELEAVLAAVRVVEMPKHVSAVTLHSRVRLENTSTGARVEYAIVSGTEANWEENKLSEHAPVARALMNHRPGDIVNVTVPKGTVQYKVLEVLPLEL
jgi:transcription elongation factor GreA